jgi:hypothetical protein
MPRPRKPGNNNSPPEKENEQSPMASELEARRVLSMDEYYAARTGRPAREPFRPFPKLWEAFADDPETLAILDSGLSFDRLFGASEMLATRGKQEARATLVRGRQP